MLLSQIEVVPLQSGWTTASGASFSTSSSFFSGAQGRHRRHWGPQEATRDRVGFMALSSQESDDALGLSSRAALAGLGNGS
jgi:hypothetical protein